MSVAAGWYPDPENGSLVRWWDGAAWTSHTQPRLPSANGSVATAFADSMRRERDELAEQVQALRRQRQEIQADIVETRGLSLLQEVGLYRYSHPLDDAAEFKDALAKVEAEMQAAVKKGGAVVGTKKWAINGSEKEGAKMVADFSKLMLRAYNTEADNLVRTLKPYALESSVERLQKMRGAISKLGVSMKIEITDTYHAMRVRELQLTADYLAKVAEEKEAEREARARLKEEEAARREYQREQEKLEKEKAHYEQALNALRMKGDTNAAAEAEKNIAEIQHAIDGVVERAANVRAGYVYVISNFGAFGERVVKIGMTRRLDPMDRVRELGDASVPFRFDVHAIIFSDDAVGLETELHHTFAHRQLNLVNARREFFLVTPQDVKQALLKLRGNLLSYTDEPEALEWRQSETTRRQFGAPAAVAAPRAFAAIDDDSVD